MPRKQAVPLGEGVAVGDPDGEPLGLPLGDPLVLGDPDGDPLGLVLGEGLVLVLGDALVLLAAADGLALAFVPVFAPVRPAVLDAPAEPAPGDGRVPGVVALADVDAAGAGLSAGSG
jgi:hypothetical protein